MTLAARPPLGWNSYDSYGGTVTEAEFKANAAALAGLRPAGYEYAVMDYWWYRPSEANTDVTMDGYGRFLPSPNRFPSAGTGGQNGFAALADYVHSLGLKFGLHMIRGVPKAAYEQNTPILGTALHARDIANPNDAVPWTKVMYGIDTTRPGAQAYYDSLLAMYASWGVDYLKADNLVAPFHGEDIAMIQRAIRKTGRPIVLSLSPGEGADELPHGPELAAEAQVWRISDDVWDNWSEVRQEFDLLNRWSPFRQAGNWPDPDMLPLGHLGPRAPIGPSPDRASRLTIREQYTVMSLWSITRSPLMIGANLTQLDATTRSLLTNPAVLAVDQNSANNHQVYDDGSHVVWEADAPGSGDKYVALFNTGALADGVSVSLASLGLAGPVVAQDLWGAQGSFTATNTLSAQLGPHDVAFYRVSPTAGAS